MANFSGFEAPWLMMKQTNFSSGLVKVVGILVQVRLGDMKAYLSKGRN